MKLTCNRNSLLNAINIVSKAVSSRTTLPILECILLDAGENFKLTANDLELGIETAPIEAEIDETGKVALEAKLFSEIIRKVNGENVKIEVNDKNEAVITSGTSEFKIIGQNGEEFPSVPTVSKSVYYRGADCAGGDRPCKALRGGDGDSADAGRTEREPAPNLRGGVHAAGKFGNHPQDDGRDAAPYFRRVYARVQCERFL